VCVCVCVQCLLVPARPRAGTSDRWIRFNVCVCVCVCAYIHTTHTHTHTYVHTRTHTYTPPAQGRSVSLRIIGDLHPAAGDLGGKFIMIILIIIIIIVL